ncbi:DUF4232 domain-containing protein [Streptomyces albidus (ex Kaewkla and Franco 2022)]|uniref:DUF4232 domain-containing protein n=1 Tax=Streptomyces albidus (ex Kaewkla and Franco 2022) TaxID=722709 RepID=UPI0015EFDBFC|nr:DUF4232 domain-containing protein [Streptomyces albidus (ex Kaewkla and Franco 2022)]
MLSRARRILPARLLASVLPLSLSACEGKGSDNAGDSSTSGSDHDKPGTDEDPGKGDSDGDETGPGDDAGPGSGDQDGGAGDEEGTDVGPCDDKTELRITIGSGKQTGDTGSAAITIRNTGSGPCILPEVLGLSLSNEDGARIAADVQTYNSDGEVPLSSRGTASAKLNYSVDKAESPVAAGQLDLDQIGRVAVDKTGGPVDMAEGTVQLTAFQTA